MTCIVGIEHGGKVFIGGDSAGVAGYSLCVRGDQKVFTNGSYVFGFTSSFRMGQLLRYGWEPPVCEHWDLEKFMATTFVDALRKCLSDGGFARNHSGEESAGTFLVGTQGRLFTVESDYQVGWLRSPYSAVGCGAEAALGALHAIHAVGITDPEKAVFQALQASEAFSAGVRGPFHVEHV